MNRKNDGFETPQRRTVRLKNYDYAEHGAYFITICTFQHVCMFGDAVGAEMIPNEYGLAVSECWASIPSHFSNADTDVFIVMPNHVHGIILIKSRTTIKDVKRNYVERFGGPRSESIPTMIRSFKSACTKKIRAMRGSDGFKVWQSGFYEHVIRNEDDLNGIRAYIITNSRKLDMDEYNPVSVRKRS